MKTVNKDELFQNLSGFLKSKGINLEDGSYTHRIRQGCNLLSDIVNATEETAVRAKAEVEKTVEAVRETLHKATAPKTAPVSSASKPPPSAPSPAGEPKSKKAGGFGKSGKRVPAAKRSAPKRRQKK